MNIGAYARQTVRVDNEPTKELTEPLEKSSEAFMSRTEEANECVAKVLQMLMNNSIFHSEFSIFFSFLGLKGNSLQHKYEEIANTIKKITIENYIIDNLMMLPINPKFEEDDIIVPVEWSKVNPLEIKPDYVKNVVYDSYIRYINQMQKTAMVFSDVASTLFTLGLMGGHDLVKGMAIHVENDIKDIASEFQSFIKANDMTFFLQMQEEKIEEYVSELENLTAELVKLG